MNKTEMLEQEIRELKHAAATAQKGERDAKRELHHVRMLVTMHEGCLEHTLEYMESIPEDSIKAITSLDVHKERIKDVYGLRVDLRNWMDERGIPTQVETEAAYEALRDATFNFIAR